MSTALATITAAIPQVFELVTTVLEAVLANPILVLTFAASFVGLAISIFRQMRSVG